MRLTPPSSSSYALVGAKTGAELNPAPQLSRSAAPAQPRNTQLVIIVDRHRLVMTVAIHDHA